MTDTNKTPTVPTESGLSALHGATEVLCQVSKQDYNRPFADEFVDRSETTQKSQTTSRPLQSSIRPAETVIKDIGLCRREKYSVKTLLKEFSCYDLASFEGFDREEVIQKQEQCENLVEELSNLPTESGALIAEECTIEEINELTKDNPDLQVVNNSDSFPIPKEKKPPVKSKYGGQKLEEPLQCSKCRYTTYYKRNFQTHQEVHEKREARVYHCKESGCTAEFKTRKEYKLHGPKAHKAFICDNCGLRCSSKSALRDHMARHQMRLDHKCPYCQRGHNTKADLRNHVRFAHLFNISYPCELCGMTFQRKFSLKEHLLTHSDTYNYPCTICDKKFKTNSYLKSHISVVHERVRLRCSYCPADFERNYKLHNHIENTHGIQVRFVCDVCVLTFQSQEKLDSHRARHNNPHELECGRCLSGFQSKDLLASHLCITYSFKNASNK
ncbi:AAEL013592-PA [Aedes aegypti]|uniref:AAEL013592-PA n=1 Tax=Aedes aegypti TaxID=7159 RepID=Q16IP1_AEDAE|nr:AAEL013592-PA [Aedes aegypti]